MRSRRVRRVVTVRKGEQHVMQRRGGALGTERALIGGAARIAFHMDDLIVLRIDELRAADRAIGANAGADLIGLDWPRRPPWRSGGPRRRRAGAFRPQLG